jgi:diguanylate cyclase (GGDEF)-like protein
MTRAGLPPLVPFAAGAVAALIGSSMARARTSTRPEGDLAEQRPGAPVASASDSVATAPHEVAERRSLERQLHRLEHTDPLTGAANRVRLRDRLSEMLGAEATTGALLILDLDDFRLVNELYGHTHGDILLVEASRRLEIVARQFEGACLSRLGGDEFALLLPDVTLAEMRWVCAGLLNRLRQPVSLGPAEIEVGTSIGLVMLDAGRRDVDDALRDGDLAMYAAKSAGKNRWKQFAPAMHEDLVARLTLEGELAIAIDEDQLDVHYQPLVRLDGQRIVGVEALVRWTHPTRGPIPPEEFLVAAERGPLIHRLGGWILRAACQQLVDWSVELGPDVLDEVAVNVSPRQLLDPHFAETVAEALAVTGLDPARLVLEITESTAMAPNSQEQLQALRATGVRLAIDDFGTGHSSLSRLAVLPVNTLKVDRSFVRDIPAVGDAPLVRAMIAMAHSLGLTVVAEGIENERQRDYLTDLGCEHGQGYLFSRPVPAAELASLLVRSVV